MLAADKNECIVKTKLRRICISCVAGVVGGVVSGIVAVSRASMNGLLCC